MPPVAESQLSLLDTAEACWVHSSGLPVRIRRSLRARRLSLRVVPPGWLEVVVPRGVGASAVRAFVDSSRKWIDAACAELGAPAPPPEPPTQVALAAIGRSFAVRYRDGKRSGARTIGAALIEIERPVATYDAAAVALRRWLLARGRETLRPWLVREAARTGAEPAGVQIRLQRTRWGSCSSARRISLNAALLLVAPELVRYLLVHELCHLMHMNHSKRFWARVRRFEPDADALDARLGREWQQLPDWLFGVTT